MVEFRHLDSLDHVILRSLALTGGKRVSSYIPKSFLVNKKTNKQIK